MNIDEYREMVAAEKESAKEQPDGVAEAESSESQSPEAREDNPINAQNESTPEPALTDEKPTDEKPTDEKPTDENQTDETTPTDEEIGSAETTSDPNVFNIEGIGEVTLDEVKEWQKGNMRTQDYTKKTQAVAAQRKEAKEALELYNYLQQNPHIAKAMLDVEGASTQKLDVVSPENMRVQKVETELMDMKMQTEIERLSAKYEDFEVLDVLEVAYDKNMTNLEDAYKYVRGNREVDSSQSTKVDKEEPVPVPAIDLEAEKTRIRAEVLAEIDKEKQSTQTIISGKPNATPTEEAEVVLTEDEDRVRSMMGVSKDEWVKWKVKK